MIGYSGTDVFRGEQIKLWEAATYAVARLCNSERLAVPVGLIRCHELARAVAGLPRAGAKVAMLLAVQDGWYGAVDHSWITVLHPRRKVFDLLDVYCVGRLPMVQLISLDVGPMHGALYRPGPPREDIDHKLVKAIRRELLVEWVERPFSHAGAR